ncbi:hypothetical protein [Cupriavidus sp. WS]|uniref:hypothetical protein n=1 Tax=Cupriavidus sp. WS TaxID=1312922 RepID=UPI000370FA4B|nr:hypothetical protein [Cupriavidus sp. WS]
MFVASAQCIWSVGTLATARARRSRIRHWHNVKEQCHVADERANCTELADDYILLGDTDLRVLLSHRAATDLNQQARELADSDI